MDHSLTKPNDLEHCFGLGTKICAVACPKSRRDLLSAQHDHANDEGDKATASLLQEISLSHNSRNRAVLGQIDAALKRIKDGSFGECLNCGQEINRKRLEAIPWVLYCITCQELLDSTR